LAHAGIIGQRPLISSKFDTQISTHTIRAQMIRDYSWRPAFQPLAAIFYVFCLLVAGCERIRPTTAAPAAKSPTIASLVPSATQLLIDMGAGDHLVAVSNYDRDSKLPKVGDYQVIDWEKLSGLRPNVLVTYYGQGHVPVGMEERGQALGITILNLKFQMLSDVYAAIGLLGNTCGEPAKADAELKRIQAGLHDVHQRVAGEPKVRAVIVTGASGLDFAGRSNYLDDLLNEAGGENAVTSPGYVTLDREAIAALKPQVVLQLLPAADDATIAKTRAFWESFPDVPAVKDHRVWLFRETYMMTPGSHVTEVAEKFATALHPPRPASTQPSGIALP
jgi:ABC-type Fe3+-hydroxamate transport system substrate-binding protein